MQPESLNAPLYPQMNQIQIQSKDSGPDGRMSVNSGQGTLLLGPSNTVTTCPFCYASIKTAVKYTSNTRTHILATLCWLVTCCLCCIPYCMNSARNSDHYCPNCERYLGTYQK